MGLGPSGWVAVAIFVGVYVLVATERVHRVAAALGGAGLVLAFGIVDSEEAFYSRETGIDWDVIFLLLGMMLVVGILRGPARSSTWRSTRRSWPGVSPARCWCCWSWSPRAPRRCWTT